MKMILIAILAISFSSFADTNSVEKQVNVFPQITVWPHGIDLRIWNTTDKDLRCSGSINIRTANSFRYEFYNGIVYRGMTEYRRFNNWNPSQPYMSAFHSIRCYAY